MNDPIEKTDDSYTENFSFEELVIPPSQFITLHDVLTVRRDLSLERREALWTLVFTVVFFLDGCAISGATEVA